MLAVILYSGTSTRRDLHVRTHTLPPPRSSNLSPAYSSSGASRAIANARSASFAKASSDISEEVTVAERLPEKTRRPMSSPSDRSTSRSEEHTSELKSLMRISYAVFCLKKKNEHINIYINHARTAYTTQH